MRIWKPSLGIWTQTKNKFYLQIVLCTRDNDIFTLLNSDLEKGKGWSCSWEMDETEGGETELWRQKVEDGESVTFWGGDHSSRRAGAVVPVAAVLTGSLFGREGQARSRGSERMLRTLKVSDSKRGLGSRGDIMIYWLLRGSSWPEFEITVTAMGNGNICVLIFTLHQLCSQCYANMSLDNSWPVLRN